MITDPPPTSLLERPSSPVPPAVEGPRVSAAPRVRGGQVLAWALLAVPVVVVVWMGWQHRWTADDGFINLRVVRHIVEGHGPVFNTGQRIETGTSPLWLAVLSVLDLLTPFRLEWIAAITALAMTGAAVALAMLGTRRVVLPNAPVGAVVLPLGALVYAAIPAAWDFSTSGLENGLGLLWLATCWWLVCASLRRDGGGITPRWWVPVVLSLGPLVRPDFAVFSIAFVAALLVLCERRRRTIARVVVTALVVPLATELARMAYYGRVVPTTAIAKEAMSSYWAQGWSYLRDYAGAYGLAIPLLLLLGWWFLVAGRSRAGTPRPFLVISAVVVGGGLVHALYIVRVGGDFMHARMLLPTTFMVLLPVSVVAVRGAAWWLAAAVVAWAVACALWLRPPYSAALATGESARAASDPFDPQTGIADERLFWVRLSGTAHPVTIDDYQPANVLARAGTKVARWEREGRRGLLLDISAGSDTLLPLRPGVHSRLVVSTAAFGLFAYAAGDDVDVVDNHGLASVLAAQQRLVARGRPGHEKVLPDAWVVAQFADPHSPVPGSVSRREVAAARRALACEPLRSVVADVGRPLTLANAIDGALRSPGASQFRFSSDPIHAEREVCGPG